MTKKIKYEQYELIVAFKADNCFSITAQFTPTNQLFSNNSIELMRINKETVYAALERKNEKNIRCQFQQVFQEGKKQLQLTFIVNFDFLPEFRQQVRLEYVQQKQSLKKLSLTNMQAEISQMNRNLQSMETNGSTSAHEMASSSLTSNEKKELWIKEVKQGKYIVRFSGMSLNSAVGVANNLLIVKIYVPGQNECKKFEFKLHHQASYYYPFFASQIISCRDGSLKVQVSTPMATTTLTNVNFVMNQIVQLS